MSEEAHVFPEDPSPPLHETCEEFTAYLHCAECGKKTCSDEATYPVQGGRLVCSDCAGLAPPVKSTMPLCVNCDKWTGPIESRRHTETWGRCLAEPHRAWREGGRTYAQQDCFLESQAAMDSGKFDFFTVRKEQSR